MREDLEKLKVRCPRCREWVQWKTTPTRPFCSDRCKNHDLGDWATERYKIPVEEENPSDQPLDLDEEDKRDPKD